MKVMKMIKVILHRLFNFIVRGLMSTKELAIQCPLINQSRGILLFSQRLEVNRKYSLESLPRKTHLKVACNRSKIHSHHCLVVFSQQAINRLQSSQTYQLE